MKTSYQLIVSVLFCVVCSKNSFANVLTVSNDPNRPAQYNDISTAFAAAVAGDTLYVYGSPNIYGDLTINKPITVIGNGFNPRKEIFYHSNLNDIYLSSNVSNVTMDGITCRRFLAISTSAFTYTNITLKNCYIYQDIAHYNPPSPPACGLTFNNWLIQNCFIRSLSLGLNSSCSPAGPIVTGFLVKNCHITTVASNRNLQFVNCQLGNDVDGQNFVNNHSNTFDNCIFERYHFLQTNQNTNNVFHNCLTYQTQSPSANFDLNSWSGGASGSATGCIINQNPLWVNGNPIRSLQPVISTPVNWDPALQPGSPAINAGSDGTNIGINGGTTPFVKSGEPNIPVIRKFQLVNAVVPTNGTVTLKATATKAQ
ncbi:MAG TPA: hypothetical protein PKC72_03105 [Chitinophagaceae bacterium]|nr:hypothetical protein [Chitinophagaceae bacterium]